MYSWICFRSVRHLLIPVKGTLSLKVYTKFTLSWNKQIRNKIIQKSKKTRNSPLMLLAAKLHPGNGMGHLIFFIIQPMLKLEYRLQTMGIESWDHWASIKVRPLLFFQPKDKTNHKKNTNYNFPANFIFVTLRGVYCI